MSRPVTPIDQRFFPKLRLVPSGCVEWTGARTELGYGVIGAGPRGTGIKKAHRVAYEIFKGLIPEGLFVLHKCDNPPCCNPEHLSVGTAGDNARDMSEKGRASTPAAKLSHDDVREIRALKSKGVETNRSIADRFGIQPRQVRKIASRKQWRHVV